MLGDPNTVHIVRIEPPPNETSTVGAITLVLERQQRRPQQILVRIVECQPPLKLCAAAADDAELIAVRDGWLNVGVAVAGASAMGEDEAAELRRRPSPRLVRCPAGPRGSRSAGGDSP